MSRNSIALLPASQFETVLPTHPPKSVLNQEEIDALGGGKTIRDWRTGSKSPDSRLYVIEPRDAVLGATHDHVQVAPGIHKECQGSP